MTTKCPDDNRVYCKAYYEKTKQDPEKLAALRERRARNQRERRLKAREYRGQGSSVATGLTTPPVATEPVATPTVTTEITAPLPVAALGGKHSSSATQGEVPLSLEAIISQWHDNWDMEEAFEERAAIMEFDGGLTREEAEQAARESLKGFTKYAKFSPP